MMIELMGRGFAQVALVLSFIAGDRTLGESIKRRLDYRRLQLRPSPQRRATTMALSAFVTLN
jgi:hypothetical protein